MKPRSPGNKYTTDRRSYHVQPIDEGRRPKGVILVVEDDEAMRTALCDILNLLKYRVLMAEGGQEAVEIFKRERVDIVLSDLIMPEMDGESLYQALCEINPDVRMIVLTGLPLEDMDLSQAGIFAWIQKPLDIDEISQTISAALKPSNPDP
ncbi:MAG: response regulator [Anaerolineales bacterium]|nr:response regulator [Anaerolineales bacterium]